MENPSDDHTDRSFPFGIVLCCAIFLVLVVGGFLLFFGWPQSMTTVATISSAAMTNPMQAGAGTDAASQALVNTNPIVVRLIELTNYYSCALTNPIGMGRLKAHPNNLGEFPSGEGEFGGVLFAVRGMIQLGAAYPRECRGINIGTRARAFHILHGTAGLTDDGTEIARLIIHYADGEEQQLPINYGEHLRDWWAWKKDEDPNVGSKSEQAWTGNNRFALSKNVELRVYRSAFLNPFPDKVIETIDYIRTPGTSLTPFMLGLTIEEAGEGKAMDLPAPQK